MSTSVTNKFYIMNQYIINKVWVDNAHVWAETTDGLKAGYAFSQWKRLAAATQKQREDFTLSRFGIHWPSIDEDINFACLFADAGIISGDIQEDAIYYQS